MKLDFFFFKQKTAYEMRISDWSSDVCSSDLLPPEPGLPPHAPPPPAGPPPLAPPPTAMPFPAEGQAPDVAADMPQPEQAAVGSDTEAPISTGHGHHACARAPGSRLLGDEERKSTRLNSSH